MFNLSDNVYLNLKMKPDEFRQLIHGGVNATKSQVHGQTQRKQQSSQLGELA